MRLVAEHRLSCSAACGILVPLPGTEPTSPALQGRCLTTGPPGKSLEGWAGFNWVLCSESQRLKSGCKLGSGLIWNLGSSALAQVLSEFLSCGCRLEGPAFLLRASRSHPRVPATWPFTTQQFTSPKPAGDPLSSVPSNLITGVKARHIHKSCPNPTGRDYGESQVSWWTILEFTCRTEWEH